jgi:hypothetical protein
MIESIPIVLQVVATGAKAASAWQKLRTQSKGNAKKLILELQKNLRFCTLVLDDGLEVGEAMRNLSTEQYDRLAGEDPNLKSLKPSKIRNLGIEDDKNLAAWQGKTTVSLVDSIYEKIEDIRAYYPHPKSRKTRRWNVRVANIRNRILLLLVNARAS